MGDGRFHLVPGAVPLERSPDGNSIFLDAPEGLVLVDTGRHLDHAAKLLAYARSVDRPIVAIVNTHWHLDHTTGNLDIREVFPDVEVYATTAIEGALAGFLGRNRPSVDEQLADPATPPEQKAQLLRGRHRIDHPDTLRPTHPVVASGPMTIAGRTFDVHVAPFAATEADLWLFDADARLAIVGDLVVDLVPFMDTACPDGWIAALEEIATVPFKTLIPGHGPVMGRADFLAWKRAFENLIACGRSDAELAACVEGWERDAARFIPESHRDYVREAAEYYVETRLRSSAEERRRFCAPLGVPGDPA